MATQETRIELEAARREVVRLEKKMRQEKMDADEAIRKRREGTLNDKRHALTRARNQAMMLRRLMTRDTYEQIGKSVGISAGAANRIIQREMRSIRSDPEHELRFIFLMMVAEKLSREYEYVAYSDLREETTVILRPR